MVTTMTASEHTTRNRASHGLLIGRSPSTSGHVRNPGRGSVLEGLARRLSRPEEESLLADDRQPPAQRLPFPRHDPHEVRPGRHRRAGTVPAVPPDEPLAPRRRPAVEHADEAPAASWTVAETGPGRPSDRRRAVSPWNGFGPAPTSRSPLASAAGSSTAAGTSVVAYA